MWATILTVCNKELTDHLRDRRTAAMIFFLSIAMGPLLLIGLTQFISSVEKKAEAREVFVQGREHSSEIANFFCAARRIDQRAKAGFSRIDQKRQTRSGAGDPERIRRKISHRHG